MTPESLQDIQSYITGRLDRITTAAAQIRVSALRLIVCLTVGPDEQTRERAIQVCIEAGLLTSPVATLTEDIQKIVTLSPDRKADRDEPTA